MKRMVDYHKREFWLIINLGYLLPDSGACICRSRSPTCRPECRQQRLPLAFLALCQLWLFKVLRKTFFGKSKAIHFLTITFLFTQIAVITFFSSLSILSCICQVPSPAHAALFWNYGILFKLLHTTNATQVSLRSYRVVRTCNLHYSFTEDDTLIEKGRSQAGSRFITIQLISSSCIAFELRTSAICLYTSLFMFSHSSLVSETRVPEMRVQWSNWENNAFLLGPLKWWQWNPLMWYAMIWERCEGWKKGRQKLWQARKEKK